MSPAPTITYLRAGRHVRATGTIIRRYHSNGAMKVKPTREGWGIILVTAEEIEAGKEKPPIQPREKPTTPPEKPKRERKPKPAPLPRWKKLVERVRLYEVNHHPEGWPGVQMKFLSEMADELEAAQNLFQSKP
jgi:hypothetical protein